MDNQTEVRWELARRFELIEWRVYWQGRVNRYDLEERFDISSGQASADLRAYQSAAPRNIEYDKTEKAFLPTKLFSPKFLTPSADRYLAQLNAIQTNVLNPRDTWFASPLPAAVLPAVRTVEPETLRHVLDAIRTPSSVEIDYQSLTNRRVREIAPHALGFDGLRWHVRAWCLDRREFRDFVLSRIVSVKASKPFDSYSMKDIEWHRQVDLRIVPHPDLPPKKQEAIARDYGMIDGQLILSVRLALAFYAIRTFNLDLDLKEIKPERKQIFLANLDQVEAMSEEAKARTKELISTRTPQR